MKVKELIERLQEVKDKELEVLMLNDRGEYEDIVYVGQQVKIIEGLKGDEYRREIYIC